MKIGILLLGESSLESIPDKQYSSAFTQWLQQNDPSVTTQSWKILKGEIPESPDLCDGWILTGSSTRIVDPDVWQESLEIFIRQAHQEKNKLFGVCFGHQSIARALGGQVETSPHGLQCGLRTIQLNSQGRNLFSQDTLTIHQSHFDRVCGLPKGAELLGSHDLCPIEAMRLGDHILSFQGHPEFTPEMVAEDIELQVGLVPEEQTLLAREALKGPHDGAVLAQGVINFFLKNK